jgi:shikimate dehydrogenase
VTNLLRFAVLGDPVSHSRSPQIQEKALNLAGMRGEFLAIEADPSRLKLAIEELRTGAFDGLNITMPLKEVAAELIGRTGAVNTLRCRNSLVEGISTDTSAFRDILDQDQFSHMDSVLILGSGGSALSALATVKDKHVYLSARNTKRASELLAFHEDAIAIPWGTGVAGAIVVNCTPIGMRSETLPDAVVKTASALIDLPYGPPQTPSVDQALLAGIPTIDGYEFLARQAAGSFEWWTGVHVDFNLLTETARNV